MEQTPENRPKNAPFRGAQDGVPFTSENQPTPQQKSEGWQKKKFTRALIQEFLQSRFNLSPQQREKFKEVFGINPDEEVSVGAAGMMNMADNMMKEGIGAKQSFSELMNQAFGQPKQEIETTGENTLKIIHENIE